MMIMMRLTPSSLYCSNVLVSCKNWQMKSWKTNENEQLHLYLNVYLYRHMKGGTNNGKNFMKLHLASFAEARKPELGQTSREPSNDAKQPLRLAEETRLVRARPPGTPPGLCDEAGSDAQAATPVLAVRCRRRSRRSGLQVGSETAGFHWMVAAGGSWRGRSLPGRNGENEVVRRGPRRLRHRTWCPLSPVAAVEAPAAAGVPAAVGASPAVGTPASVEVSPAVGAAAAAGARAAWSAASAGSGGALTHLPASRGPCSRCVCVLSLLPEPAAFSDGGARGAGCRDGWRCGGSSALRPRGSIRSWGSFSWVPVNGTLPSLDLKSFWLADRLALWVWPLALLGQSIWKVWVRGLAFRAHESHALLLSSSPFNRLWLTSRYRMRKLRLREVNEV